MLYLDENQECLKELGVSTEKIDKYVTELRPYVHGTKITGAGGGGCLFSIAKEGRSEKVFEVAKGLGLDAFRAEFRGHGVEINGEAV